MICLSFDVEERFHSHLTDVAALREWKAGDRIARIVDLLQEHRRVGTFFIVSELAERYPELIRRIAKAGFEIGSHSHSHLRLDTADMVLESFQLGAPPDSLTTAKPSIIRVRLKKSDSQQHLHRHQSQQKPHATVNNALQQFVGAFLFSQQL